MTKSIVKIDPFFDREAKKYTKPIPSREFILQYLEEVDLPLKISKLIKAFNLKDQDSKEALRRRLRAMLRDGQLLLTRRGDYALVKCLKLIRGYVLCHRDGYGFLVPDDGSDDIFLSPKQMRRLFPGDRVLVSVTGDSFRKKREGIVVEILERSFTQIVGRFLRKKDISYILPVNKNIMQEIIVSSACANIKSGQLVVANITDYPTLHNNATAQIIEVLGDKFTPGMEIEVALRANALPFNWPEEVLKESNQIKTIISNEVNGKRKGLQHLPFVTIDGEDAKDFDDAVYCEKKSKGGWLLYVAIADVSHYVSVDSALDKEALKRGNSVYFPGKVVPMLPEILSCDLCSLRPNLERLAVVCEMHISCNGKIVNYSFYDAVIKSHARFTYDEVFLQLENKSKSSSLLPYLQELNSVNNALLKQRKLRGALDFSRIETKIVFSDNHKIEKIVPVQHNYVHGIIEECMLAANFCASLLLQEAKIPALYRVHEAPDPEKLTDLRKFLANFDLELKRGKKIKTVDYAEILHKIIGRPDEHLIQTVMLRSLRQAIYTPDNKGHFGLGYEAYVHFTSPIRRYPDLINHRAIKYLLCGKKIKDYHYTKTIMHNYGDYCSQTERRADEAVRDAVIWLKCEFMKNKVGKTFVGIISGVTNFGIFVELKDIFVEGLVHITSLKNDYYSFDPSNYMLIGKRSKLCYRLGDLVKVMVTDVDLDEMKIDFNLA